MHFVIQIFIFATASFSFCCQEKKISEVYEPSKKGIVLTKDFSRINIHDGIEYKRIDEYSMDQCKAAFDFQAAQNSSKLVSGEKLQSNKTSKLICGHFQFFKEIEEEFPIVYVETNNTLEKFEVELYFEKEFVSRFASGTSTKAQSRELRQKWYAHTFLLGAQKGIYDGFLILNSPTLNPTIFLTSLGGFLDWARNTNLSLGIYYGLLVFPIFVNFILYFFVREKYILYFNFYLIAIALNSFFLDGYIGIYFFPNLYISNMEELFILPSFILFFLGIFTKEFLNLKESWKFGNKVSNALVSLILFLILIQWISFRFLDAEQRNFFVNCIMIFYLFSFVGLGYFSYQKKVRNFFPFSLAWTPMLLGAFIFTLKVWGWVPDNFFTENSLRMGIITEILVLSILFGGWFGTESKEREIAESKLEILNQEISAAKNIQNSILPTSPPRSEFAFVDFYFSPAMEVGGDFIDFTKTENGIGILIADVKGSGFSAAMVSSSLKFALGREMKFYESPKELVSSMNETLFQTIGNQLLSLSYSFFNFKTNTIISCNAGQIAFLILPKDENQKITRSQIRGPIIGREKNPVYLEETRPFQSGERFLFFTNGFAITQDHDASLFSEFIDVHLAKSFQWSKENFLKNLVKIHTDFLGAQTKEEDITIAFLEVLR